jgi:predicted RNA-binding Zn-ribbon protein involved in translation (DUF1610 family)
MQRNGQNPIRKATIFNPGAKSNDAATTPLKSNAGAHTCPKCGTAVPPKPGFRPSALRCPKCGASPVKK